MAEHDTLIGAYEHLNHFQRASEALHMLRKIASLVKPIMRNRGWRVRILTEFYPEQQNLLGLNVNRGWKICLRLRYPRDNSLFLPIEEVVDTMLHELCHNVHGPHNDAFHALWEALRDEHEELVRKGYTGEGFLGEGQRLGGRRMPMHEMRRQAHTAAVQRNVLTRGSGHRLGGSYVPSGVDVRAVIAEATTRRMRQTQGIIEGCASGAVNAGNMAEQASLNGFRTVAEENEANDRAIAQALWELVQEQEDRKVGAENGTLRSEGLVWSPATGLQPANPQHGFAQTSSPFTPPAPPAPTQTKPAPSLPQVAHKPLTTVKQEDAHAASASRKRPLSPPTASDPPKPLKRASPSPPTWPCSICTLVNTITYLCCDACGSQRPAKYSIDDPATDSPTSSRPNPATGKPAPTSSKLKSRSGADNLLPSGESAYRKPPVKMGWNCEHCGTFMENQWWTCSLCGVMKSTS